VPSVSPDSLHPVVYNLLDEICYKAIRKPIDSSTFAVSAPPVEIPVEQAIKVGVSSCLLGNNVRYDGGNALDRFITDTLGKFLEFCPVCPEAECGLGIPREPMRLVGDPESPRLVTVQTNQDLTERMLAWARTRVAELERESLCGFIFKSRSPSSGMERVKVYGEKGLPVRKGVGLFAASFMEHFPLIPVEDDERLHDMRLREHFIERVFTFKRWRDLLVGKRTRGRLVDFHTRHKLLILSHSPEHYRALGRLVASIATVPLDRAYDEYQTLLMAALRLKTTPAKNANALHHVLGYFKACLSSDEKQELIEIVDNYANGSVPLIVPMTLLNHFVRKYDQPYLKQQFYLNPDPLELQLRNHV